MNKTFNCPAEITLNLFSGKWKVMVLWHLRRTPLRFGELKRLCPGVTQSMLATQLRELERSKILGRKVFDGKVPKVEYALTKRGESLKPIIKAMVKWGLEHQKFYMEGKFSYQ